MSHEFLDNFLSTQNRATRYEYHDGYIDVFRPHGTPTVTTRHTGDIVLIGSWACLNGRNDILIFPGSAVREVGVAGDLGETSHTPSIIEVHLPLATLRLEGAGASFKTVTGPTRTSDFWVFVQTAPGELRIFPRMMVYDITAIWKPADIKHFVVFATLC